MGNSNSEEKTAHTDCFAFCSAIFSPRCTHRCVQVLDLCLGCEVTKQNKTHGRAIETSVIQSVDVSTVLRSNQAEEVETPLQVMFSFIFSFEFEIQVKCPTVWLWYSIFFFILFYICIVIISFCI